MQNAITVSKYNSYINQIFASEEFLHHISVVGEVSGVSVSRQTAYFSLKDSSSSISCVCFMPSCFIDLKEGKQVVVTGSPNYYSKLGKLSFNVSKVQEYGLGDLYVKFIEMKNKLENEGLFDECFKKALPESVKRIGVITSKDGAVIQDIKSVVQRRDKSVDIVLLPCKVQGLGADKEIADCVSKLDEYGKVDVIVIARGGGSLEDLSPFNTEIVARAVFDCKTPIISAVGHETDFTICDFTADLRAPTPSVAGELLTCDKTRIKKDLKELMKKFNQSMVQYFEKQKSALKHKAEKINYMIDNMLNQNTYNLSIVENTLKNLSPKSLAKKGFAKIEQGDKVIDSCSKIMLKSNVNICFYDGQIRAMPLED